MRELSVARARVNLLQGYLETIHVNNGPHSWLRLSTGDRHHGPLLTISRGKRTVVSQGYLGMRRRLKRHLPLCAGSLGSGSCSRLFSSN
jgi:hypothetical protein